MKLLRTYRAMLCARGIVIILNRPRIEIIILYPEIEEKKKTRRKMKTF